APHGQAPAQRRTSGPPVPQEERILELVAGGRTNKQIGEELHLAEKTVKNYVSSILAKLEVTHRAEAASYLTRHTTTPGS
ncbi:MAG: response regulator transcription factor, partial [Actinomycetes bacterium]